jgi:hypothetical protein
MSENPPAGRAGKTGKPASRTGRYLKYAIGEIILVMVGILLALQINNWNEGKKIAQLKQKLYVELRASIMTDTVSYNNSIKHYKSAYSNAELLKAKIASDAPYSSELDSSFALIERIQPNESDYIILRRISDVGIEIIDDAELKNEFIHYYEDSKNFVKFGGKARELLQEIYPKYFISHDVYISATPEDFEQLKKANDFKVALDYCFQSAKNLIERTTHRKILAANILTMLENQITIPKDQLNDMPYIRTMGNDSLNSIKVNDD